MQLTQLMTIPVFTFELTGEIHLLSQMLPSRVEQNPMFNDFL